MFKICTETREGSSFTKKTMMQYLVLVGKLCFRTYVLYEIVFRRAAEYHGKLCSEELLNTMAKLFCLTYLYHFVDVRQESLDESKKAIIKGNAEQRRKVDLWGKKMMHLVSVLTQRPSPSANNFRKVSAISPCLFAKSSKIDSHAVWNTDLSLEENILLSLPLFYDFVRRSRSNQTDGFVYELPNYGRNLCEFSLSTKRVLKVGETLTPGLF